MKEQRDHAVVVGASIGGLLAARALADHFRQVTVIERDELSPEPGHRRGVPQDRHVHILNGRGCQILEEFFPGILGQLIDHGAVIWEDGDLSRFYLSYGLHALRRSGRLPNPPSACYGSRPVVEWAVRHRTKELPNVTVLDRQQLMSLTSTGDCGRITGVCVVSPDDAGGKRTINADLTIDATGRGSHLPVLLEELGYGRPPVQEVTMRLVYASQQLRMPAGRLALNLAGVAPRPDDPTTWALSRQDAHTWILTVGAMVGQQPPTDWQERISCVAGRVPADVLDALASAEPLGAVNLHRLPSSRWRRYDKMSRFPYGLLVVGDAICSFNPVYGQGMAVAAQEAIVLGDCLRKSRNSLAKSFFRETAKRVQVAWQMAVGGDLAMPGVIGPRPPLLRAGTAYLDYVTAAAEADLQVAERFLRVAGMLDSPSRMLHPAFMLRVAIANWLRAA